MEWAAWELATVPLDLWDVFCHESTPAPADRHHGRDGDPGTGDRLNRGPNGRGRVGVE